MAMAVRAIRLESDGSLVLPLEVQETLGVEGGASLVLLETPQGALITTKQKLVDWALDGMGAALREAGVTLDDLLESGERIREEIFAERYGSASRE